MSIYSFNIKKAGEKLLPPNKRKLYIISWVNILLTPIEWLQGLWSNDYLNGQIYPVWDSGTSYAKGDRVVYKVSTYEAFEASTGLTPEGNRTQWYKLNDSFIGVFDRARYTAQKVSLESFLNRWFSNSGSANLIFIENNPLKVQATYFYNEAEGQETYFINQGEDVPFVLGDAYTEGDTVNDNGVIFMCIVDNSNQPTTDETYWRIYPYIINESEVFGAIDFTVYVPLSLYDTLGNNTAQKDAKVQSQVDKYKPFGTINDIKTY